MGMLVRLAIVFVLFIPAISEAKNLKTFHLEFGPFNSYDNKFSVNSPATINGGALQVTPDSIHSPNYLKHRSGRVLFKHPFKLWEGDGRVASFNSSFLVNIYRLPNSTSHPGEGFAFLIAPDLDVPPGSDGQYLGLTNSTTDGNSTNHLIAVELDTFKQDFDPDDNHMGLDINSVRSNKTVSLSNRGIQLAPEGDTNYTVWVQYDGGNKVLDVYMAEQGKARPTAPVLSAPYLDLRSIVKQHSYFGFAASTGNATQLHCVLRWNLTVEVLPEDKDTAWLKDVLEAGVPVMLVLVMGAAGLGYYLHKKRAAKSDPRILGTVLKTLPGTPREFRFRDLKKATNNFDEKQKLGQGGFGVVYKGVLPKENVEVAVKKFSRENIKGKDDFLSELTIINRLRHKHLVRLLGWCHKNGMLLLVYDYMPNGSLDNHLFCGPAEKTTLGWNLRYKIVSGVASALHYLHNEFDQKVVHRDLKASNILLDSNYNARLGDFGLAHALDNDKTYSYAELEGVAGTMGYIAPECYHTDKATRESDIYGFGAVLLEVVCGRRPWNKFAKVKFLVDWVWTLHQEGRILDTVDEGLGNDYVVEEAERLLRLGLACSHPIASERPKTPAIVQIISGSLPVPYVPPFKPAFVWPSPWPIRGDNDMDITSESMPITCSHFGSGSTPQCGSQDSLGRSQHGEGPSKAHGLP